MAAVIGILAASDVPAASSTKVYQVEAGEKATDVYLTVCNRNTSTVSIRVAVSGDGTAAANEDFIEYGYRLPGNRSVKYGPLTMQATSAIYVYASTANTSAVVWGSETTV